MRIEFAATNGPNIEVSLVEDLGGADSVKDRFYTATRAFPFCMVPNSSQCGYERTFYDMELVMAPPVIGGRYSALHPYWEERRQRAKNEAG